MPLAGYSLIFEDGFSDLSKWTITTRAMFSGYGKEIWDASHAAIVNGQLALDATPDFHSGEVRSIPKFGYGYYECRAKLPSTPGFWPAFWLLSSLGTYQEIDISECDSSNPNRIGMNLHWGVAGNSPSDNGGYSGVNFQEDFHTYGCLYLPGKIEFYVDEVLRRTWTQPNTPVITDPMEVRLSLSIFGPNQIYATQPNSSTIWPGVLLVDWVKVWIAGTNLPVDTTSPVITILSPMNGTVVPRKSKVTVRVAATDNAEVNRVEFQVNGSPMFAVNTAPYNYEFSTTGKPKSEYRVEVVAYDSAGNSSRASVIVRTQ